MTGKRSARRPKHEDTITDLKTYAGPFVRVAPLAAYVGCDPRTILRLIAERTLPAFRVGRSWRIPTDVARAAFSATPPGARTGNTLNSTSNDK